MRLSDNGRFHGYPRTHCSAWKEFSKSFGAVVALKDVTLQLPTGEITGLVGDNGAGKSTLIKIISGMLTPDSGSIEFLGKPANFASPADAREQGVETVYQDLALAGNLAVWANLYLGRELTVGPKFLHILDKRSMLSKTSEMLKRFIGNVPPIAEPVELLSGGQRQVVAIARAGAWGSKLILMDEPTAALGVAETKAVEEVIFELKRQGLTILVISHNLDQVFRITDGIWVMRRGRVIGYRKKARSHPDEIVSMITGAAAASAGAGGVIFRRWGRSLSVVRRHGVLIVFILLVASMFVTTSTFGTYQNLRNVLQQNSIIGIIACGMTFAIILGGFDLSVGSMTALASVVGATLMIELGTPGIPIGIVGAVAACLLVGAHEWRLIAYLGVNPFVATLGTMTVVRGLIYVATNASPRFGVPYSFTTLGLGRLFGIPNPAILFLFVAVLLGFILHRTRFGHYVYAVGGNSVASARMGVNTARVRFAVYVLVSACAAISGIILVGQTASATPQAALGYELTAIAAVIVGGAPLGGGRGRMTGTIVGVFLLGVVANGLNLFGVSPFWQPVATGLILIAAVAFDGYSSRGAFGS